jgi:hypothetical protein
MNLRVKYARVGFLAALSIALAVALGLIAVPKIYACTEPQYGSACLAACDPGWDQIESLCFPQGVDVGSATCYPCQSNYLLAWCSDFSAEYNVNCH